MKTDKNSVIGFVLLGALFILYFWYTGQQQNAVLKLKQREEDSLAKIAAARVQILDTVTAKIDSLKRDTAVRKATAGNFTLRWRNNRHLFDLLGRRTNQSRRENHQRVDGMARLYSVRTTMDTRRTHHLLRGSACSLR